MLLTLNLKSIKSFYKTGAYCIPTLCWTQYNNNSPGMLAETLFLIAQFIFV